MSDFSKYSDSQLIDELNRRSAERERIEQERLEKRKENTRELLKDIRVIDMLAPEHERTSCDDANRKNGDPYKIRCRRCLLLNYNADPEVYGDITLDYLSITF